MSVYSPETIIPESELILNPNGSVYHLNLFPEDIADLIITVGDPERVPAVSHYFDRIEIKKQRREFVTHTGYIGAQRLSVISTGISTDNIDIVLNELDALANIDLQERRIKSTFRQLSLVRIGTAGGLQPEIGTDSFVVSSHAIGLEGLANFYHLAGTAAETALQQAFCQHFADEAVIRNCYAVAGDSDLVKQLSTQAHVGVTVTCGGFYGPQGRQLRLAPRVAQFVPRLTQFAHGAHRIANFEMETAGIYALGYMLGHRCCSMSTIITNRCTQQYSATPAQSITRLIEYTLERLTDNTTVASMAQVA